MDVRHRVLGAFTHQKPRCPKVLERWRERWTHGLPRKLIMPCRWLWQYEVMCEFLPLAEALVLGLRLRRKAQCRSRSRTSRAASGSVGSA